MAYRTWHIMMVLGAAATAGCASGGGQSQESAAGPVPSGPPGSVAGQWEGTFVHDVTQTRGNMSFTLSSSNGEFTGQIALTPGGVYPVSLRQTGEQVTGTVDGSYEDPGCKCVVVTSIEGTVVGQTFNGSLAARDARTGQWHFSTFTATRRR